LIYYVFHKQKHVTNSNRRKHMSAVLTRLILLIALLVLPLSAIAQPKPAEPVTAPTAVTAPATPAAAATATVPTKPLTTKVAPTKDAPAATKVTAKDAVKTVLPVVDPDDPGAIIKYILQAIKEARWAWLAALILMLLTFILNKILKNKIPKKVLPWIAIGLGVGTNIAMSFATGLHWLSAIGNGITLGLAAAGGWSAIGKLVLGPKKEADSE
jgi:hypothetical protein